MLLMGSSIISIPTIFSILSNLLASFVMEPLSACRPTFPNPSNFCFPLQSSLTGPTNCSSTWSASDLMLHYFQEPHHGHKARASRRIQSLSHIWHLLDSIPGLAQGKDTQLLSGPGSSLMRATMRRFPLYRNLHFYPKEQAFIYLEKNQNLMKYCG